MQFFGQLRNHFPCDLAQGLVSELGDHRPRQGVHEHRIGEDGLHQLGFRPVAEARSGGWQDWRRRGKGGGLRGG